MDVKKKPSFVERMKEAMSSKVKVQYPNYTGGDIQSIIVKARLCLENRFTAISIQLQEEASRLNGYLEIMENDEYQIVQELAEKVVELRAVKTMVKMLRRLEESAGRLAEARGNVYPIGQYLLWLQNILWAKRVKNIESLEELYQFCRTYFRGVDIVDDSTLTGKLCLEIRQLSLRPRYIPFDMIHNYLQMVLNTATSYPLERKMRMINLNRENIEVLRAMMDEQHITNDMQTPTSSIRLDPQSPSSAIRVEAGQASLVRKASNPGGIIDPRGNTSRYVYGLPTQKYLPGLDRDELYSLSLIRKYFNGEVTPFCQQLMVRPFEN